MRQIYEEDEISKVTVTFAANQTEEGRKKVLKDFAQAAYNLCLYEYKRNLKENTNENQDNIGTAKST